MRQEVRDGSPQKMLRGRGLHTFAAVAIREIPMAEF